MNLVVGVGRPADETSPAASAAIRTREGLPADRAVLRMLGPRLVPFGLPPWRDPRKALAIGIEAIDRCLSMPHPGVAVVLAEASRGTPLGVVHVIAARNRFAGDGCAQIASIVVAKGKLADATARFLIESAGAWARLHGLRALAFAASWAPRSDQLTFAPGPSRDGEEEPTALVVR